MQIVSAEALLRARGENGMAMPPGEVMAVAMRHELMAAFEWATLQAALGALSGRDGPRFPVPVAVNVSSASLSRAGFGDALVRSLGELGVMASQLRLEVAETAPLPEGAVLDENLACLVQAGVQLVLDDFGTGHSALMLLARPPFDEVKIDWDMVQGLHQPRIREAIGPAQGSARRYGARLTAEGVEWGQGYILSPALPAAEFLRSFFPPLQG